MSYSCEISFKNIEPKDVYKFLIAYKKNTIEHIDDIAKDNVWYSPLLKHDFDYEWAKVSYSSMSLELRNAIDNWADSVFKFRYFYIPEHHLLGIFGVHTSIQNMFDTTIYFQNSTDQDYAYDTWNRIPWFEDIRNKWKNMSFSELLNIYTEKHGDESSWNHMPNDEYLKDDTAQDYYRKSFCYEEIWDNIQSYLYNDGEVVYLSLFGFYDFNYIRRFTISTYKFAKGELISNSLISKDEIWDDEKKIQNAYE